jgi:hypothetical protein
MTNLNSLKAKIARASAELVQLETEYAERRLAALKSVAMSKMGATVTLSSGTAVFKAKKPARYNDRWNITKEGKRIATEMFGSIHDVRFAIAQGQIK